jgi:hypothetical protein
MVARIHSCRNLRDPCAARAIGLERYDLIIAAATAIWRMGMTVLPLTIKEFNRGACLKVIN